MANGLWDNVKSKFGFGESWQDEYLNEAIDADYDVPDTSHAVERLRPERAPRSSGYDSAHHVYPYESPYASGAAAGSVTKRVRRPDLERAGAAIGTRLREVRPRGGFSVPGGAVHEPAPSRLRPQDFEEAQSVADRYATGQEFVLDLTLVRPGLRQRFLDFVAGVIYASGGTIARNGDNCYLLTPPLAPRGRKGLKL
ncbi:MAG: cell division protein SepF [Actinomycetes bacterium]|nr:cell division protein SepF [Actinomycetes bacterium]